MLPERNDLEDPKLHHTGMATDEIYSTRPEKILQKLPGNLYTSEKKTLSQRIITRRLSKTGFMSRRSVKKPLLFKIKTKHNSWQNTQSWIQSNSAKLCGVMNKVSNCIEILQKDVLMIWWEIQP